MDEEVHEGGYHKYEDLYASGLALSAMQYANRKVLEQIGIQGAATFSLQGRLLDQTFEIHLPFPEAGLGKLGTNRGQGIPDESGIGREPSAKSPKNRWPKALKQSAITHYDLFIKNYHDKYREQPKECDVYDAWVSEYRSWHGSKVNLPGIDTWGDWVKPRKKKSPRNSPRDPLKNAKKPQ